MLEAENYLLTYTNIIMVVFLIGTYLASRNPFQLQGSWLRNVWRTLALLWREHLVVQGVMSKGEEESA